MKLKEEKIYIKNYKFSKTNIEATPRSPIHASRIFPTLVHSRNPLNNVTKSIIPDLVGVPRNL